MAIDNQARYRRQSGLMLLSERSNSINVNSSFGGEKDTADLSDELDYDVELPPYNDSSNHGAQQSKDGLLCWCDYSDGSTSSDSSDKSTNGVIRSKRLDVTPLKQQSTQNNNPTIKQVMMIEGSPKIHSSEGHHNIPDVSDLASYLQQPFYIVGLKRIGWLGLFLVSLSATAWIMNKFERTLESQLELAYFVPFLVGHGGNAGGQAVGTVLAALSSGVVRLEHAPRVLLKESMGGLFIGVLLSLAVGPVAHFVMGISYPVSVVVGLTLILVSAMASTLGAMLPFVCLAMGLDPNVIAAPAMTSIVDVGGILAYFFIANSIFDLWGIKL